MNREDIEHMWKVASNDPNHDTNWHDPVVIRFAELVASAEREAWEHRYARLQSLMDVRETQPNKPCCLAEREAIAQMIEDAPALMEFAQNDQGGCLICGFTPKLAANSIRARGQA